LLIYELCKIAQMFNWIKHIDLDTYLYENISGGEKNRLALATILMEMHLYNNNFAILDEPDRGSDEDTIILLNNALISHPRYKNTTFIISSHVRNIEEKVPFDKIIKIDHGDISMITNTNQL